MKAKILINVVCFFIGTATVQVFTGFSLETTAIAFIIYVPVMLLLNKVKETEE